MTDYLMHGLTKRRAELTSLSRDLDERLVGAQRNIKGTVVMLPKIAMQGDVHRVKACGPD